MLNIAAKEFQDGVIGGKVVIPAEYEEFQIFLNQASTRFFKISDQIKKNYRSKLLNKKLEVLFENKMNKQEKYFGRDKYGDPVVVESTINLTGKILDVKINNFNHSTLFGDVIFNKKRKVAA